MRIGTWNLDGNWSEEHAAVLNALDCEVMLLTECLDATAVSRYEVHLSKARMGGSKGQHWAGVMAVPPFSPLPDPHPASAAVRLGDLTVCSSVLPWPLAFEHWPWGPADHGGRLDEVLGVLAGALRGRTAVWGGDWNQPLVGNLTGFSRVARKAIAQTVVEQGLVVATADLPGRRAGQGSIDHVAVPGGWVVQETGRTIVDPALSDHDAYWVDVAVQSAEDPLGTWP